MDLTGLREVAALATELSLRLPVAHCHLALGKLYRQKNKRQLAPEHFKIAITMYGEMGLRFWLEKAEGEVRDLA